MTCEVCKVHVIDRPLYRVNPKGQPGIWRCERCLTPQQAPDEETYRITQIIATGGKEGGPR